MSSGVERESSRMQRRAMQGGRRVGAASKGVSVCVCEQSSKRGAADAFAVWYDRVVRPHI